MFTDEHIKKETRNESTDDTSGITINIPTDQQYTPNDAPLSIIPPPWKVTNFLFYTPNFIHSN